jgi:hypothetical protein
VNRYRKVYDRNALDHSDGWRIEVRYGDETDGELSILAVVETETLADIVLYALVNPLNVPDYPRNEFIS